MKNAQDAVREIKEWPSADRELLVELENGDLQFTSEAPGRVVCTKREFMDAKIDQNPTMADAVRALDGNIRRARTRNDHGDLKYSDIVVLKVGGPDRWRVYRPNQMLPKGNFTVGTVEGFEAEARRQGYVEGFEGHPDDCAFKGEYRPSCQDVCMGWWDDGRVCWHRVLVLSHHPDDNGFMACMMLGGEWKTKLFWTDKFEPLKSDRERWIIEAQKYCVEYGSNNIGRIYDAIISGELPTPEVK